MSKILSKTFYIFKYLLFIVAFALVLFGIIKTYQRLDKSLAEAIPIFAPFALLFIVYIVNLFMKKDTISNNLFYNFVSFMVFVAIITIGYRAMFDTNMLLYEKYGVSYNTLFLADNLSFIKIMLYLLAFSNLLLIIASFLGKDKKTNLKNSTGVTNEARKADKIDVDVAMSK